MRSAPRFLAIALVGVIVLLPTLAQAATPGIVAFTEAETETTVVEEPMFEPGMEPAVEAPPNVPEERDEPWTARYLAPLLLVGVIVVAAAYFLTYGARVRGRYEVVD